MFVTKLVQIGPLKPQVIDNVYRLQYVEICMKFWVFSEHKVGFGSSWRQMLGLLHYKKKSAKPPPSPFLWIASMSKCDPTPISDFQEGASKKRS